MQIDAGQPVIYILNWDSQQSATRNQITNILLNLEEYISQTSENQN